MLRIMTRHRPVPIGFASIEEADRFIKRMQREGMGQVKPRPGDETKPLSGYETAPCHPAGNGE